MLENEGMEHFILLSKEINNLKVCINCSASVLKLNLLNVKNLLSYYYLNLPDFMLHVEHFFPNLSGLSMGAAY